MSTIPKSNIPPIVMQNIGIPMVYFNSFNANLSNSEISAFLLHDGQPAVKIVMPLAAAKSLAATLSDFIERYEKATKTTVLSTEEIIGLLSNQST